MAHLTTADGHKLPWVGYGCKISGNLIPETSGNISKSLEVC